MSIGADVPEKPDVVPANLHGNVSFPLNEEGFTAFVQSLLGRPQTLRKTIRGQFNVGFNEIRSVYQLLNQRIYQQNDARLLQFVATLVFSDESTVRFGSLTELLSYNEVRPVYCIAVHLTFSYLIRFADKDQLEKQEITLSIIASRVGHMRAIEYLEVPLYISSDSGYFEIAILHTARTWAADIEALLTNYATSIIKDESPFKRFFHRNDGKVGFGIALALIVSFIGGSLLTSNAVAARAVASLAQDAELNIQQRLDNLLALLGTGFWSRHYFYVFLFVLVGIAVAIALGVWISAALSRYAPSHLLLTSKSSELKAKHDRKSKLRILSLVGSIALSIATGVLGNCLFNALLCK